ncbi:bifunctional DNA primase/polymerase [Streptomyces polyrhachis]|uniref:Bifunctional DNA primase/polymerase n=1 Tax=Streptomyces polyrhachis TaxID=1282885 RepID=A0ABW2GPH3_9ACTN
MPAELRHSRSDSTRGAPPGNTPPSTPVGTPPGAARSLAHRCAALGWPVLPLAAGRKTPAANCEACRRPGHTRHGCPCLAEGRWCHGFHAATLDEERIDRWWGAAPQFGVGVSCGPARLVVIDIDAHTQSLPPRDRLLPGIPMPDDVDLTGLATGFHTLAVLSALRGVASPADDAATLRVRTPSGGLHVWYRAVDGRRWQCSTGSGSGRALAWQVDVRAHGGYIIAPGTRTTAGAYTALSGAPTPAPLPAWLAYELERTGHLAGATLPAQRPVPPRARQAVLAAGGPGPRARALAPLLAEVTACALTAHGAGFSEKLNRAAYTAGGLIAAGHLDEQAAALALRRAAALARPGQERRAEQIIRGALSAGAHRPLTLGSGR